MYGKKIFSERFIGLIFILLFVVSPVYVSSEDNGDTCEEFRVLFVMANGVGQNYFDILVVLEEWNYTISVVGTSSSILSCHRKDPQWINADYVVFEVDEAIISNYDCLIIPSGGHHTGLTGNLAVLNLISTAYRAGLVVGGICTGLIVLAEANNIVSGVKVATFGMADQAMKDAGAIIEYQTVVIDKRIVTGGPGGGLDFGGNTVAPTPEFCEAIHQAVLSNIGFENFGVIIGGSVGGGLFIIGIIVIIIKKRRITR